MEIDKKKSQEMPDKSAYPVPLVGSTFQIKRGPGKPYKAHVLAIVDVDMVVYKWYGRHKQWWHYEVKSVFEIKLEIEVSRV